MSNPEEKPKEFFPDDGSRKVGDRTDYGINYTAAFVLVASGTATLAEISRAWKVAPGKLANRSKEENWAGLIRRYGHIFLPRLPGATEQTPEQLKAKMQKIETNRDRVLASAQGLMDQIALTLKLQPAGIPMDSETISELSRAVKMLGEISMIATGDEHVIKSPNGLLASSQKKGGNTAHITINMPPAISAPRKIRDIATVVERSTRLLEQDREKHAQHDDEPPEDDLPLPERPDAVTVEAQVTSEETPAPAANGH